MLQTVEYGLMLSGMITVLTSLFYYYQRTEDKFSVGKVVRGQLELNSKEFLFNRVGLYLLAMGVMIRYVNQIFM